MHDRCISWIGALPASVATVTIRKLLCKAFRRCADNVLQVKGGRGCLEHVRVCARVQSEIERLSSDQLVHVVGLSSRQGWERSLCRETVA